MISELIYLVDFRETGEADEYSDPVKERVETQRFAALRSIGQSEFYQAATSGFKPEIKFVLQDYADYDGQPCLRWKNVLYKILRTYRTQTGEIEIVCYGGVRDAHA